jgi:SPP1 family predicted phage head-tail adaptor
MVRDAGALNQRLTLELPVETPDGAGGVTRSYAAGAKLWASVVPVSGRAGVVADGAGATVTHRIVIRAGPEVTTRHRLRKGARVWRIAALREEDSSGRFLVIEAQERRD